MREGLAGYPSNSPTAHQEFPGEERHHVARGARLEPETQSDGRPITRTVDYDARMGLFQLDDLDGPPLFARRIAYILVNRFGVNNFDQAQSYSLLLSRSTYLIRHHCTRTRTHQRSHVVVEYYPKGRDEEWSNGSGSEQVVGLLSGTGQLEEIV
jgi:hypothetical protein